MKIVTGLPPEADIRSVESALPFPFLLSLPIALVLSMIEGRRLLLPG